MKKPLKQQLQLADQHNALTMYLEALLNEANLDEEGNCDEGDWLTKEAQSASSSLSNNNPPVTSSKAPLAYLQGTLPDVQPEPMNVDEVASVPERYNEEHDISTTDKDKSKSLMDPPSWAIPRFQALTFSLANLDIAAPLEKLNGIIPLPEHLTSLPGQSPWFLGLVRNRDKNVQVIDLATIIQPANRVADKKHNSSSAPLTGKYILLMDDSRWGILCDTVATVLTLEPQQIVWRRSAQFDFILGTAIEKMHSILCVDHLVARLNGRCI